MSSLPKILQWLLEVPKVSSHFLVCHTQDFMNWFLLSSPSFTLNYSPNLLGLDHSTYVSFAPRLLLAALHLCALDVQLHLCTMLLFLTLLQHFTKALKLRCLLLTHRDSASHWGLQDDFVNHLPKSTESCFLSMPIPPIC